MFKNELNSNATLGETIGDNIMTIVVGLLVVILVAVASSCSVNRVVEATVNAKGPAGAVGPQGATGAQGIAGLNGLNAKNCITQQVEGGVLISCGDSSAVILNGTNGQNAQSVIGIKGYIFPCGKDEFANDEIFLRLTDDNILALYDGGPNMDRLVLLAPGSYATTDRNGKTCHFTVTNNLQITNEHVQ